MAFFSSFGQTFFISLFGERIRETFTLTHGGFGLCYSIATLCSGFTIIWVGQKLDAIDLRPYCAALCVGLIAACLGMAFAPVVLALGAALYLLRLTGQGLLSHTAMTSMARYFDEHRGKAMSVAGLGFPAGEAVLPIIAVTVLAYITWRQAWLGIAALLAVVMVPIVLWLLRGHTARHATHVSQLDAAETRAASAVAPRRQWTRGETVRDPRFYLLLPAVVAPGFIVTGLFFHQVHLVESKGWTMTMFAATFAIFAGAQLPAGLLAGPLVDRIGATRLVPACLIPFIAGLVVLAASRRPAVGGGVHAAGRGHVRSVRARRRNRCGPRSTACGISARSGRSSRRSASSPRRRRRSRWAGSSTPARAWRRSRR